MLNRGLDKQELLRIVEAVANEKSIDKELVISSMESAIQKAALTKFGNDNNIEVVIDRESGDIKIQKVLDIVENVEDTAREITLNDAKKLGDVLVVVVATDKTALKMKKRKPLHSAQLRQELVSSLSIVDLCIIGDEENIFKTVDLVKPQIIALGYDQTHQEKFITDGCKKINLDVKVARLESPRPETSSSLIQKEYGENIHDL